jgi:hypothetical protein
MGTGMKARLNEFSAKNGLRHHDNDNKKPGTIRQLAADDPRNLNHPCHDEQWLELARSIGRAMAREQFEKDHKGKDDETEAEDRSDIRKILK